MQVNVSYLDNLKLEASFDEFKIISDQPVRYQGDNTAPGPFDYFLASSVLCAAYFVKLYCKARDIDTSDIKVYQNNLVDPENRYHQDFHLQIELPHTISKKDRLGMIEAMNRCTVKRVIQNNPKFIIEEKEVTKATDKEEFKEFLQKETQTNILGKDKPLEESIKEMATLLTDLGINIEIHSWRNPVPHIWSVHIRDADCHICYTNGKGTTKEAALASALGEYIERLSTNYFYNDYYLGPKFSHSDFTHYKNEKWFPIVNEDEIPKGLMDESLIEIYNPEGELKPLHLVDTNSANTERGICALPFVRQSDQKLIYIPYNILGNLFVSNGMSAGNTQLEARVQALSEIFERAVKNEIIKNEYALPDIPNNILKRYPNILEGINKLEEEGFHLYIKDASMGGLYPVICITLMNPKTQSVFASFGAHPKFEVALERTLTELMQGRSFQSMDNFPAPTFNEFKITEHNNIVDHFIDSSGVLSWRFFKQTPDFEFNDWNIEGNTQTEYKYLMGILNKLEKEVYIASYPELGTNACRILVPGFSEIYEVEDLVWDNNNEAITFRSDILNIHNLKNSELKALLEKFNQSDKDDYTLISELIGIAFDEGSIWGQLTILELKIMIHLKLLDFETAHELISLFITYNDNTVARRKYYSLMHNLLEVQFNGEDLREYKDAFIKMYSLKLYEEAQATLSGKANFHGLYKIKTLDDIPKHRALLKSFSKISNHRFNIS
jgi:ribosomal protein S12 methylthiotransferase accessory factor